MGGEPTPIQVIHKGRYATHLTYPEGEPRTPLRFVPVRSPLHLFGGIFRSFRQAEAAPADRRARFEEMAERRAALSRFAAPFLARMDFLDEDGASTLPMLEALRVYPVWQTNCVSPSYVSDAGFNAVR